MKSLIKSMFTAILILICIQNRAQDNDTLYIRRNETGTIAYARFKINESSDRKMENDTVFLKSILKAKEEDSFRIIEVSKDTTGYIHKWFQQYYKGLKVDGQQYLIHGKNGNIKVINGDFQIVDVPDIVPKLTEQQSLQRALDFIGAKKYKWEDDKIDESVIQTNDNSNRVYYPKGELLIAKDLLSGSNSFKLCWKFSIYALEPFDKRIIYVDAKNGDILNDVQLIDYSNTQIYAQTNYSGNKYLTGDYSAGKYRLQENREGVSIYTLDLNQSEDYEDAVNFENNNNYFTSGNWSSYSIDSFALDLHYAAETTLDYWDDVFERNSIDDNGLTVMNYMHYGVDFENAGWDPDEDCMFFGDGFGVLHPFTSLDAYAHEFAHGINKYEKNLGYYDHYSEAEALNEGFSDIWGACVEHGEAPEKSTWLHGEEITYPNYSCLRNIEYPNDPYTREHFSPHPDTYEGDYWWENDEPHQNSTVLSHWFYLLSEGDSGINDNDDPYTVYGIGIDVAQKIAYELETDHLVSTSNYADAADGAEDAAEELFTDSGLELMQVKNAWYAVGIGSEPTQMSVSYTGTGNVICPCGVEYEINDVPSCDPITITWECSNNISLSDVHSNPVMATPTANGSGWILPKVSSAYSTVELDTIYVTVKYNPIITGSSVVCSTGAAFELSAACSCDSIIWSAAGSNLTITSGQKTYSCTFAAVDNGSDGIKAKLWVNGSDTDLSEKEVWAGKPIFNSISGTTSGYTGQPYDFWANPSRIPDSQSSYQWMVVPPYYDWYFVYQYYDWVTIVFNDPYDYYQVMGRATNTCGATNWQYKQVAISQGYFFSMYPNPSSNEVTITINETESLAIEDYDISEVTISKAIPADQTTYSIRVYNSLGTLVLTATRTGTSFNISISNLRDGTYIVELSNGKNSYREQLIIKHE